MERLVLSQNHPPTTTQPSSMISKVKLSLMQPPTQIIQSKSFLQFVPLKPQHQQPNVMRFLHQA